VAVDTDYRRQHRTLLLASCLSEINIKAHTVEILTQLNEHNPDINSRHTGTCSSVPRQANRLITACFKNVELWLRRPDHRTPVRMA